MDLHAFVREIEVEVDAQQASWRGSPAPALLRGLRASLDALGEAVDEGEGVEIEAARVAAFAVMLAGASE